MKLKEEQFMFRLLNDWFKGFMKQVLFMINIGQEDLISLEEARTPIVEANLNNM